MNRRERRNMQKAMGLNKHYKKESKKAKFERWQDNQANGKRMMDEMAINVDQMQNESDDERATRVISTMAAKIAQAKKIPMIDAMVEAQSEYEKTKA